MPISLSVPITALAKRNRQHAASGAGLDRGTNNNTTTTQSSPLANANAPVNACSLSVGLLADASSSCSTTSVGLNRLGAIGNVNVPLTAQDNAIGLLSQAASVLGLTSGQSSASKTQNGAINAGVPVSICAFGPTDSGASSPAPPPPNSGNPVAPVVTSLGNTAANVDASMTTAAKQVASSVRPQSTRLQARCRPVRRSPAPSPAWARTSRESHSPSVRQRADNGAKRRVIGAPRVRQNFGSQRRNNNSK